MRSSPGAGGGGGGGESTLSTGDYLAKLNAACALAHRQNQKLPALATKGNLAVKQVQGIANRYGDQFTATVKSLNPPAEHKHAQANLLKTLSSMPMTSSSSTKGVEARCVGSTR